MVDDCFLGWLQIRSPLLHRGRCLWFRCQGRRNDREEATAERRPNQPQHCLWRLQSGVVKKGTVSSPGHGNRPLRGRRAPGSPWECWIQVLANRWCYICGHWTVSRKRRAGKVLPADAGQTTQEHPQKADWNALLPLFWIVAQGRPPRRGKVVRTL